jgi:DNA-binding LytR/AlgR family response regulator
MNTRCFLVDDEPIALDILTAYLGRLDGFAVSGAFTNPVQAFSALQSQEVDLLFLDIQMPELTGLELLQSLHHPPAVILTTAYREFALEGFNLDVVDYLLKPIAFDRFLKAIAKFEARRHEPAPPPPRSETPPTIQPAAETPYLFVRADRRNIRIRLDEILYLESLKDYVRIVTSQGKWLTKETLAHFEETLPKSRFLRVHRSFIVAKDKVTAHSINGLEVGPTLVPVGRLYKLAVEKSLYQN